MSRQPICEYLDVDGDRLIVSVRVPGVDLPSGAQLILRLRTRGGRVIAEAAAPAQIRVNTIGERTRSQFVFRLDAGALPAGAARLEVHMPAGAGPEGELPEERELPVAVDPSTGLLASSRPLGIGGRRVQVFPAAGKPATWLRIGSTAALARFGWAARNLARDIGFAVHGRRFTWVRLVRALTAVMVPRGEVWLVGERPETARDNGWAFFEYVRRQRPAAPVYYILRPDSRRWEAARVAGNVVAHSSWRHRLLLLHADVLINAYSIKHLLPDRWHPGAYMKQCAWRIGARRVYLKHGVHLSPDAVKRANGGYDLVCTVGPGENAALAGTTGYGPQLRQTGLARYDTLVPDDAPERAILFMPTWRRYLVPTLFGSSAQVHTAFEGSTYQQFLDGFLTDPGLGALLDRENLTLDVVPHYNLGDLLQGRGPYHQRIRLHDAHTADIPGLIRSCATLVTDYSSVHFDAAYLGVPVVYAQFDEQEYTGGHSAFSWFRFDLDGFGPITATVAGTVAELDRYARAGFQREPRYGDRVAAVFTHQDRDNRRRILAAIDSLGASTP